MPSKSFRFGIGEDDRLMSSAWIIFPGKNDLYLGLRNMAHSVKISVHGSGVCQFALTEKYWEQARTIAVNPPSDRCLTRWHRAPVPDQGVVEVLSIWFPSAHHSKSGQKPPAKGFTLIKPAPSGKAVRVTIAESMENTESLERTLLRFGLPIVYYKFDNGRTLSIVMRLEVFDESRLHQIRSGSGTGTTFDPSDAPAKGETKSGLSMLAMTEAHDGQPLHIAELHGINLERVA